jgi:hypothetical protein
MLLPDFLAHYPSATVTFTQTTYVELATAGGMYHLDLIDKAEFRLRKGTGGALAHYTTHPLLSNHNELLLTLYINSKPADPKALLEAIEQRIGQLTQGWREWHTYLLQWEVTCTNVRKGLGLLLRSAPVSLAREVIAVCEQHGVATRYFEPTLDLPPLERPFSVLFIGANYVVARDFRICPLPGAVQALV